MDCATRWIDLGQVSKNNNSVSFSPDSTYGGWSNPMVFSFPALLSWKVPYTLFFNLLCVSSLKSCENMHLPSIIEYETIFSICIYRMY